MPSRLIDIPCDDIFKNDQLGLEPAIAARTEALLSRSPQAIAIDGQWGTGKTTFLALWAAYLRGKGVKVVQFNAWKSFEADPLDALTRQILRQVDVSGLEQKHSRHRLLTFLKDSAPLIAQGTKLASTLQPELEGMSPAIEVGLESIRQFTSSESTEETQPKIESPDQFTSLLSSAAKTQSGHPVVVMVDELDRCSPEYSVEMLQLLEHVFQAEHVVFVVAMNHSELVHSIRSFYGQGFNAEGYLERFFDDILSLPTTRRRQYIDSSLNSLHLDRTENALAFLENSGLSLREIDKSIQHLESILENGTRPPESLIDLWILRSIVPVEYRQFMSGEISDKALADAVYARGTCNSLRAERQLRDNGYAMRMEVTLIAVSCTLPRGLVTSYYDLPATKSELYRNHQRLAKMEVLDGDVPSSYSQGVLDLSNSFSENMPIRRDVYGIHLAVRLLDRESSRE